MSFVKTCYGTLQDKNLVLFTNELRYPFGKRSYVFIRTNKRTVHIGIHDECFSSLAIHATVQLCKQDGRSLERTILFFNQLKSFVQNTASPLDNKWQMRIENYKNDTKMRFWRLIFTLRNSTSENCIKDYVKGSYGYEEGLDKELIALLLNRDSFWSDVLAFLQKESFREHLSFSKKQAEKARLAICEEIARLHKKENFRNNIENIARNKQAIDQLI